MLTCSASTSLEIEARPPLVPNWVGVSKMGTVSRDSVKYLGKIAKCCAESKAASFASCYKFAAWRGYKV
ncbi:hypothetical protein HF325_000368 [Metschnikowia pulcherrima]|uniref:Uncharacterized protein n=1 Tax=Metschnikowia pulcherrima TaxID=27326 RepID=A0A8H7GZ48_9ASCO|nr:hypothetical protein HF325_000368 [Metschnikowia pulcherrima]